MQIGQFVAQGDVIIERVADATGASIAPDPDGAVVLARGEVTGHRHAFYGGNVAMFRSDDVGIAPELYIGHVKITAPTADLSHEEHDTLTLPSGTYRIRRQREWDMGEMRIVAD